MKHLLLLALLLSSLAGAADEIDVGLLDDRAPYSDFNVWQHASGALPELLDSLSVPGQLHFTSKPATDLAHLKQMLQQRKVQVVLPPPLSLPPPGTLISHPLLQQRWALITRNNHLPLRSGHATDLNRQRILLLSNSPAGVKLTAVWPDIVLEEGVTLGEALKLLNTGAADGIVCDAALADILTYNLYSGLLNREILPELNSSQSLWVAPGEEVLLQQINARIDELPPGAAASTVTRWLLSAALNNGQSDREPNDEFFDSLVVISSVLSLFLIAFLLSEILRRRRAERGLKDALTYWQTLLNSVPTPLLVCNPLGEITHCNQTLLASLSLTSEQVIGITLEQLITHNPIAPSLEHREWVSAISTQQPQFSDRTILIQNETREIVLWLAVYHDSRSVPQGLLIGWYDISERKRLERELAITSQQAVNANREKSDFLARMSHEIRSPMNAILGVLELEQQKQTQPGSALNVAYAASRQLLQIVGGVLDLSKIEAGEMQLQPQNGALFPLLTQVVDTYSVLALQKGLRLESDIDAVRYHHYRMDGAKLTQILSNLLGNAIKYTERGFVSLQVTSEPEENGGECLTFCVEDSGLGIAAEMQEKVLQPYVQLDAYSPASTGLGLAICTQLLKLMGSALHIHSTVDHGSCFSFSLRLEKVPEQQDVLNIPQQKSVERSLHLLVVDDQPANLVVMKLQLETLGHQVVTCDDGKQAEQLLARQSFDLVLTDCQMPVMTGYELARRQREREQEKGGYQVMIGCTANAFNNEQKRCLDAGMDGVLIKPLTLQDLRQLLSEQDKIQLDMAEIQAMAANQPQIITSIVEELQRGSEQDRLQLLEASLTQTEQYSAVLHRQKGAFALAGFQAGINLCQQMEQALQTREFSTFPVYRLQLNALILRFITLLTSQRNRE
ncbi:response regulator [Pectobacterium parmentieri]|uniref:histidine kinase n=3 Tax=Pectobacterium parmentieri TaxID=1905730 RepID=A0A0H3I1R8_PECPM|nr:response regulator [Pectobacterium parmentieri]AFI89645.1 Sensor histidine kinase/response regulator EvgS [Pectobacterium parmentieri]